MSENPTAAGGRTERSNSALAVMRDATRETAGGQAGGDSDEPTPDLAPDEHACGKCGRKLGNAGAAARHMQACEGAAEPEPETEISDARAALAYEPADMEPREIAAVCERMSAHEAQATCEKLGRKPQDGKRIQHTASLALAKAHPGVTDADAWVAAFGPCEAADCEYGAHGLDATFCRVCAAEVRANTDAGAKGGSESTDDVLFGGR